MLKYFLMPQNRIAWLRMNLIKSRVSQPCFVSFPHPLVTLYLWDLWGCGSKRRSLSWPWMSPKILQGTSTFRFTIQATSSTTLKGGEWHNGFSISRFPCLAWEGNNAMSAPLSGTAAMQARADTLRSIPENLSERVGRRSPSNCSRLADWWFRKLSIQLLPAWSTESVPSNWYLSTMRFVGIAIQELAENETQRNSFNQQRFQQFQFK